MEESKTEKKVGALCSRPGKISCKYTKDDPVDEIRTALLYDSLSRSSISKEIIHKEVDSRLYKAQQDKTVMKGLVQYMNWQDSQPNRITTLEKDYPKDRDYTVKVGVDDLVFEIRCNK